ncbi:MAG TPA: hypothetical protein VM115_13160 [Vicinamibacterales bacterium]|nr:hypothetical protein [Vicinamibacterales bacterium]
MSRRLTGAVIALIFAGSAGSGVRAIRNHPQASLPLKASPEALAIEALNSGVKRLAHKEYEAALNDFERALVLAPTSSDAIRYRAEAYLGLNRLDAVKQSYMHLFVHDRSASHVLMNVMKSWVAAHRAQPKGVDASTLDGFDAWVRERDALAMSVGNLGHNSPDWK